MRGGDSFQCSIAGGSFVPKTGDEGTDEDWRERPDGKLRGGRGACSAVI